MRRSLEAPWHVGAQRDVSIETHGPKLPFNACRHPRSCGGSFRPTFSPEPSATLPRLGPFAPERPAMTQRTAAIPPWLPLLQRLSQISPRWAVWKNADLALEGEGDIDSVAPQRDWPQIAREYRSWAAEHDLGPVFACQHIPIGVEFIAVPAGAETFVELGAKARRIFRGSTMYTAEDFIPLMRMDPRGFRGLRPGAEGLFKLLLGGFGWGGRPRWKQLVAKNVPDLLREDPVGVRDAARLLGVARGPAMAVAEAAARGDWDRRAALLVEARSILKSAVEPDVLARKLHYQIAVKGRCPVLHVLFKNHRRIPDDRERWLRDVAVEHEIWRP